MTFEINVPIDDGQEEIKIEAGTSVVFVGANGTGKTKLAVHIEKFLDHNAHRISAHRALSLNPNVAKISENEALQGLRYGTVGNSNSRDLHRWNGSSAHLLNDFDFLVQALFADQSKISLQTHKRVRNGDNSPAEPTKFETLVNIWERLLPHRNLHISGDDIQVSVAGKDYRYLGSEMSDGERAVFYMLGQVLAARDNSLIIFDEPELHVHRSIMSKLWDELESLRPDCAFVLITHDLEFAASRVADKYVLREYNLNHWIIDKVPDDSGFDESLTTLILGSRKPILFIEGTASSLDIAIYRSCFKNWTIVPKGSCEDVIHSVVTMRGNEKLTRITCSGIVDADDYNQDEKDYLQNLGIATLPVSEIENLILLPSVSKVIAQHEGYKGADLKSKLNELESVIFDSLNSKKAIEKVVVNYCKRRIDRFLKKIDLSEEKNVDNVIKKYNKETSSLNIEDIAQESRNRINEAIKNRDLPSLLANYDGKQMMAFVATKLKSCSRGNFESWLIRSLNNDDVLKLIKTIQKILPDIKPK